jgi:hypothetical protein
LAPTGKRKEQRLNGLLTKAVHAHGEADGDHIFS